MSTKFHHNTKIHGTAIFEGVASYPVTTSAYTVFFPNSRYTGGVGGQTWRVVERNGVTNNKPTYGYGDEIIMWNAALHRWEMNNVYLGTISYSPENTSYPWEVVNWYYGSNVLDPHVFVTRGDITPVQTNPQQNVAGSAGPLGYFFDGFGPGKTLNDVRVGWYVNENNGGTSVVNAIVTSINTNDQTITIDIGRGLFQSGVSYIFSNTRQ